MSLETAPGRATVALLIILAGIGLTTTPTPARSADPLPKNGRIVFARFRDPNYSWDIRSMGAKGTNDTWLSEDRARFEVGPVVSPDGTKIAYEFDYDVMIMNVDGSGRTQLTDDFDDGSEFDIAWSPDGQTVAFLSTRFGEIQLFTMPANGSEEPTHVSEGLAVVMFGYGWSPDGSHLVFAAYDETGVFRQLYTVAADGSGLAPIEGTALGPEYVSYSPDGTHLAFSNGDGVWVAEADGTNRTNIAPNGYAPRWSPTGEQLLYGRGTASIYVVNADGTDAHSVGTGTGARWSPDGRRIIYANEEIFTISPDGTGRKQLTDNEVDDRDPDWGVACTVEGSREDDLLEGTPSRDIICGGKGDDVITGLGGDDVILGGPGDDTLIGGAGDDVIAGESGWDVIDGQGGNDTVNGRDMTRYEIVRAGAGDDHCRVDRTDLRTSCELIERPI
jgi:Tol biopolymer transport system component